MSPVVKTETTEETLPDGKRVRCTWLLPRREGDDPWLVEDVAAERDPAFADVTLGLSYGEALFIADSLELLAGIDEGENTDHDELTRVANVVRERVKEET